MVNFLVSSLAIGRPGEVPLIQRGSRHAQTCGWSVHCRHGRGCRMSGQALMLLLKLGGQAGRMRVRTRRAARVPTLTCVLQQLQIWKPRALPCWIPCWFCDRASVGLGKATVA